MRNDFGPTSQLDPVEARMVDAISEQKRLEEQGKLRHELFRNAKWESFGASDASVAKAFRDLFGGEELEDRARLRKEQMEASLPAPTPADAVNRVFDALMKSMTAVSPPRLLIGQVSADWEKIWDGNNWVSFEPYYQRAQVTHFGESRYSEAHKLFMKDHAEGKAYGETEDDGA